MAAPETIFPNAMFPSAIPRLSNIARRSGCAPRERLRRLTLAKPARAVSMAEETTQTTRFRDKCGIGRGGGHG